MFEAGVAPGIKALKVSGPLGLKKKKISMNEQLQLLSRYKDIWHEIEERREKHPYLKKFLRNTLRKMP